MWRGSLSSPDAMERSDLWPGCPPLQPPAWGVSLRNQRLVGGRVAVLGGALRQGEVSVQEIRGTAAAAQPGGWSGA